MSATLEKVRDLSGLRSWLDAYCEERRYSCWHHYGPADEALYHAQSPKIMLVNSESGGYEGCTAVPCTEYLAWIKDGWRTPRNGSLLVTLIRRHITQLRERGELVAFSRKSCSMLFKDVETLVENMRPTVYMNARVTSNDSGTSHEQKDSVMADALEFACLRKRFIELLLPEIIICAGKSARGALFQKDGPFGSEQLKTAPVFRLGDRVIVSTPHLSRPVLFGGYAGLDALARQCAILYFELSFAVGSNTQIQPCVSGCKSSATA